MVESWECFNRLKFGNSHLQASKLRIRDFPRSRDRQAGDFCETIAAEQPESVKSQNNKDRRESL